MTVTALYTALSALLVLLLAGRVSVLRYRTRIGIGSGGNEELARRMRVHANALENLPLALLLMLVLELGQARPLVVHGLGIALLAGRILHAVGYSRTAGASPGRFLGTLLTWLVLLAAALLVLWHWLVVRLAA